MVEGAALVTPIHASPEPGTKLPRIAVVIPCYQDGALLADALNSLREQEPCEIVVVDDGSTEQTTLDALSALEKGGVLVVHQEQQGPSTARNAGVAATSAPYVFPLDADDMIYPGALTTLADLLDREPGLSFAWGTANRFGEGIPETSVCLRVDKLDPWRITYINEIPGGALIRRSALDSVGGWRDGTGYEDWDLWMALAERGHRGTGIEVPVQRYRIHPSRRWTQVSSRHASVYEELRASHPLLYEQRSVNWRSSRAPIRVRLGLPLLEVLPLSRRQRWQMAHVLLHPARTLHDRVLQRSDNSVTLRRA